MELSGRLHELAALPPGEKSPVCIMQEDIGPRSLSGRSAGEKNPYFFPTGNRTPVVPHVS
jgi:hypothetical protein